MFNPTQQLITSFVQELQNGYDQNYGGLKSDYANIIAWSGRMALENIANSDALYHNVEHTILVTLVGQELLRGKHIRDGGVSCEDWLHFMVSLLCHDIGYVKGVCRADGDGYYATGIGDARVALPPGLTDASLTPYHVDRGKLFIEERFANNTWLSADRIKANIELTRFPVPDDSDHQDTKNYPGLVRAADLIGQLSDPRYLNKVSALFYEFDETGFNAKVGYKNPGDLRHQYPKFYWNVVHPYIREGIEYLSLTQEGKQIIANLYSNVFVVEHEISDLKFPSP
ncbi:MAG: metal-dependent phosphohydrolase [Cyanothece sp. SIO2G6]|nr:metal-dependent phosphohydrolase [Cyanothece sp. SIO2G6]